MPRRVLLALLAGVALSLAFAPAAIPWLIPFALALRLLSLRGLSVPAALVPGAAFGASFYFVHIWWMHAVSIGAWVALAGAVAAYLTLLGAVDAVLLRLRAWPLWTALSWVGLEWLRSSWPFGGMPWGRLGFAVIDTPLAPSLPYLGTAGVAFVLALLGGLLAWLVVDAATRRQAVAAIVLVCAVVGIPVWRPWHGQVTGHIDVAAVQGNVPGNGVVLDNYRAITSDHVALTETLALEVAKRGRPRPTFVLWPENSTAVDPITDAQANAGIWAAARAIGAPVVVGGLPDAPDRTHVLNQGIVWDPVSGPGDRYTKHHPVPFGEYLPLRGLLGNHNFGGLQDLGYDMVAGTRRTPLRVTPDVSVADAICFDVAYDDVLDAQVRNGAQLVTVQTSNASFVGTPQIAQQFAITRVEALATGRYAVVAALNGITGVIAPDGHVVARAPARTQAVVDRQVALMSGTTPAAWFGTVPGQVAAGLVVARLGLIPIIWWRRRQDRRAY